jgi:preprotein translocase subunit SecG
MGGFMTGRATANLLTRATAILAGLFFVTSLSLAILADQNRRPSSILDMPSGANQAPAPAKPAAPAAPAAPSQ